MSVLQSRSPRLLARLVGPFIYPIGSIYISINSTNPGTSLGFGTWSAFGAGRVPVGFSSGETEFDTDEETGGEKTHVSTLAETAAHSHTAGGGTANFRINAGAINIASAGANAAGLGTMDQAGGGGAHNNLQPYIVVRMWKRTA